MAELLKIKELTDIAFATVMARRDADASAIGKALGVEIQSAPMWRPGNGLDMIGTGPGTWLAIADRADPDHAARLGEKLEALASVSDQSGAYIAYSVSGPMARPVLQRGLSIDLAPTAFGPGSAAVSMIAHVGVILWQVDARPAYNVALFRSFADSFRHWLDSSAAAL